MAGLDDLIARLVEARPELTAEEVRQQIAEKKEKIGAGYLTDEGAVFLVASDHGVGMEGPSGEATELKDLYAGAKEVSLETRVMSVSPARQFSRKDGSPFFLRTMTVYDSGASASVKLWDEKANLPGIEDLRPGDLVRIVKAYVKSDRDGAPTLNIGSGSSIEAADSQSSEIPPIDKVTRDVADLGEGDRDVAVSGTVDGQISGREFTTRDGRPGRMLTMRLKGRDGKAMRAVLWGRDESAIPAVIAADARVRLLGVSVRTGDRGPEIHGNESTTIDVEGGGDAGPIVARVLSIPESDGRRVLLAIDAKRCLYTVTDTSGATASCSEGDVIECMPSRAHGSSVTLDADSFVRRLDDDGALPTLSGARTKISAVDAGGTFCIEAIILRAPERRDIQTKNNESVALSEAYVEDDSGQIWVKGWRDQARLLDGCGLGEIVSITGLSARPGLEGRTELFLTPFSKVTKKV